MCDPQVRGGCAPDHRPRQCRPGEMLCRRAAPTPSPDTCPARGFLRMIHSTLSTRDAEDLLSTRSRPAVAVPIQPQVQIVQDRAGYGVRRRLVPGHHQVEAAGALRHLDVLVACTPPAATRKSAPPPIQPPVSSRLRTLVRAETLPSPYCACSGPGAAGVGGGEGVRSIQPSDPAGSRRPSVSGPCQRRVFPVLRGRIHQQGGHSRHRGRGHAGAVVRDDTRHGSRRRGPSESRTPVATT